MNTQPKETSVINDRTPIRRCIYGAFVAALALLVIGAPARAGEETATSPAKEVTPPPPPPSPIDILLDVEFASEYVTPRGMIVHDEGVTIEPLLLAFVNVYKGDGFLSSAKIVGGVWNDYSTDPVAVHAPFGSEPRTHWTEIDPIFGVSLGIMKYFTLDVTYTAFVEQIEDIGTSNHLDTKLTLDDSTWLKQFALHPYFEYWQELTGKATDADVPEAVYGPSRNSASNPAPGSSYYFDVGIDPQYQFGPHVLGGLKIEAPCSVLLPNTRFYGTYYGASSTVGLFELGLKATVPITCIPANYGHWSMHAGVNYFNFVDNNLYNLNVFNAPQEPKRETVQVYGGVSVFF
ncbi:MAG TPA: hypothetical protein VHY22_04790 [Chthoniobacteraceae bacterium]|jgi:hypothetical protein|nr:hypothetical protein [Chthoniobacteraceae bacterium]